MKKLLPLTLTLGSIVLLTGCAGTASEFECNATTSDTCMTIEQANDKAKRLEEGNTVKQDAVALPRLAEGDFRTVSAPSLTTSLIPYMATAPSPRNTQQGKSAFIRTASPQVSSAVPTASWKPVPAPVHTHEMMVVPRPLRVGEKTAALWIAPYIDTQDVYHQPGRVFFVVKPSAWGKPRVN